MGNKFTATPDFKSREIDGVIGKVKGFQIMQGWEVSLETNLIEFNEATFKYALSSSKLTDKLVNEKNYTKIEGNNQLSESDYIDNITYIGTVSGSNDPIMIQIFNALNKEGLEIESKDSDDIVATLNFEGHYDYTNMDAPPFAIYLPKSNKSKIDSVKESIINIPLVWETDLATTISTAQTAIALLELPSDVVVVVKEGTDVNAGKVVVEIRSGDTIDDTIVISAQ